MMTNKITSMIEKAKDAMKGNGTSALKKAVRKDLKEIKDRVDAVHMMSVKNVELKLISEDVAAEQMNSVYSYADNLLETWFTQVDNTIEFYNDLKDNLFSDKDFWKLTDDEYKCLLLIIKERSKLQRLSAEIQCMVCYVDTMLEDFGYLDDLDMDEEEELTDEEIHEYVQSLQKYGSRISALKNLFSPTKRYDIEYIDNPKLTLYMDDGSVGITVNVTVTPDKVVHISDDEYSLDDLEAVCRKLENTEAKDGIEKLIKIARNEEENDNEETK